MNAFEFGYSVGIEKVAAPAVLDPSRSVNFRLSGNQLATVPGQGVQGAPMRDFARQGIEASRRIAGMAGRGMSTVAGDVARALPHGRALTGLAGAAGLLGGMFADPGKRVEGAGRGVGIATGASLGGGVGAGLGRSISRLLPQKYEVAAQLAGGTLGTLGGMLGANRLMGPPSGAKQAGMVGDMTQAVKKKTEAVAGKANTVAKTVANKAVDAGKKMQAGLEKWRTSK